MKPLGHYFKAPTLLFAILACVAFLSVVFSGMASSLFGMQMDEKGQMAGCPFDGQAAICTMTLNEHIQAWQNVFTAVPSKTTDVAFTPLLLLGLAFIGALIRRQHVLDTDRLRSQRCYYARNLDFQRFNFLKEVFSQGILNPKIH